MEPALPQTLYRMTDTALMQKLNARANRAAQLAKSKLSDEEAVEELFLATLTRSPSAAEKAQALKFMRGEPNRIEALRNVLWALINTREFILNH
jgi:hypothetical protein